MTTAIESPTSRITILVRRSMDGCDCHGQAWVVRCPTCAADAYAWKGGRAGRSRSSGWSCYRCGDRGGLFKLEEAA